MQLLPSLYPYMGFMHFSPTCRIAETFLIKPTAKSFLDFIKSLLHFFILRGHREKSRIYPGIAFFWLDILYLFLVMFQYGFIGLKEDILSSGRGFFHKLFFLKIIKTVLAWTPLKMCSSVTSLDGVILQFAVMYFINFGGLLCLGLLQLF